MAARPSLYRRFVYLDSEEAVNALTYVEGGHVEEQVDTILQEVGGDGSLRIPLTPIKLGFSGRKQLQEEVSRKRTAHAAIGHLLNRLADSRDLHVISDSDAQVNLDAGRELKENDLVEFSGVIRIWPTPEEPRPEPLSTWDRLLAWAGFAQSPPQGLQPPRFVASVPVGSMPCTAVMPLQTEYVVSGRVAELSRRVTVVGQLQVMPQPHERLCLLQDDDGYWAPQLVDGDQACPALPGEPGWAGNTDDWVVVRPLCIFK